jgi:hypothetical protein
VATGGSKATGGSVATGGSSTRGQGGSPGSAGSTQNSGVAGSTGSGVKNLCGITFLSQVTPCSSYTYHENTTMTNFCFSLSYCTLESITVNGTTSSYYLCQFMNGSHGMGCSFSPNGSTVVNGKCTCI